MAFSFNKNKYGAKKKVLDGITFDSGREAQRYAQLKLLERSGYISELRLQVVYELVPSVRFENEKRAKPAIRYIADFTYIDVKNGCVFVVEDAKNPELRKKREYRMLKHMMKHFHGLEIRET